MFRSRRAGVALLATGALIAAGCGDDDSDSGSAGTTTAAQTAATPEPATLAIEVAGDARTSTFTAPATAQAGVTEITLTNSAAGEHEAQLIRVDGDQTAEEVVAIIGGEEPKPIPDWLHAAGGAAPAEPGSTETVTVVLQPGRHFIMDMAEEGAAEPVELTVEGDAGEAELPEVPATVVAKDYSFEATGLKPGENRIRFDNQGEELHHVIAFPLNEGADFPTVVDAFASEEEPEGPPPVDFENQVGTAVLDGGTAQNVTLDLEAGRYAFVCFIPDRAGGPPHVAKGMINEITVE